MLTNRPWEPHNKRFAQNVCKCLLSDIKKNFAKFFFIVFWAGIYLFKIINENIRAISGIWSKLTKASERPYWRRFGVFIVNFEKIHILLRCFHGWPWTIKYTLGFSLGTNGFIKHNQQANTYSKFLNKKLHSCSEYCDEFVQS